MSSDNAQSAVTYTSISSISDGPSWGISLMNAGEIPKIDPYEEVAQQGQAHPLSPAYVPDPVELDEHVSVYVPEPEHPEYHAPSDDDIQGSDETEPFEEDEIAVTPPPPRHRGARISVRPQTPMAASTQALIDAFAYGSSLFPLPPTNLAYDQAQLGRRTTMIRRGDDILEEEMPPRRRFTLTGPSPGSGRGLIRSPSHDTRTITRAADRAEDVGYAHVRRQESANFYTHVLEFQTGRRDIRLEIDVVRGQRIAYETELQEVHQAYLSFEAQNRALLARLETLETHMSRMEWQRQSTEDLAVTQMMRIHTLKARARADTVEDVDSSC
nr:hypothetical protein [Tanacetum cinerariifolium]